VRRRDFITLLGGAAAVWPLRRQLLGEILGTQHHAVSTRSRANLAAIAESRRNASLREIDRRRAVLGGALRQGVQEVEDAEFKVIERRRPKGKDAA
jgi:hypothetical protein